MEIFLNILFLIIGMVLLIKGADFFVDGASAIAKKLRVPGMLIGLTVVALGTSLPELSVSLASAVKHNVDMAVSNVVGSNMMNMLLILGIVALIRPFPITKDSKVLDFPFLLAVTALLFLFGADVWLNGADENVLSRAESIVLVVVLIVYMTLLVMNAIKNSRTAESVTVKSPEQIIVKTEETAPEKTYRVWQIILLLGFGIAAIVFGAECVSTTAQYLALRMGFSETLVGLTIVAVGTSLPELVTSVVAAVKGETGLALGNIIGSNVVNIALILGVVGMITQIAISTTVLFDILILFECTILFVIMCFSCRTQSSVWMGIINVGLYLAYLTFAIVRNYCF